MKKIFINEPLLAIVATLFFLVTSCQMSDFGDVNVDRNNASTPNTAALLTNAMRTARLAISDNSATPILWVQHWSEITYTQVSTYSGLSFDYSNFYTAINNLNYIIELNTGEATKVSAQANGPNNNQIAVARILRAALFQMMTDRWGDIPYSEAVRGQANFKPKFDRQQDIYNDLFIELKAATTQMVEGTISGDIILGGDMTHWKKYANSIRLNMALRLSKIDAAKGRTEFAAALQDGVLTSNADNVTYKYLKNADNQNPWYASFDVQGRLDFAISVPMINSMAAVYDPRLPVYADKSTEFIKFVGMPYGLTTPGITPAKVSLPGKSVRSQDSPMNFITHAQVLFDQAEAAKLGWTSSDTRILYNSAIKASLQQWNVYSDTAYARFIARPAVQYNDAKAFELIATQKWIALYMQGYEAWADWRRTGLPKLTPAPGAINPDKQIPRRQGYPTTERDLNALNYRDALAVQGPDAYSTRVWWDK